MSHPAEATALRKLSRTGSSQYYGMVLMHYSVVLVAVSATACSQPSLIGVCRVMKGGLQVLQKVCSYSTCLLQLPS